MRATIVSAALLFCAAAHAASELHVDGKRFADAAGRTVVLRGVNIGGNSKVPPFQAITAPAQLDPLPGWGINVVRLLFTWEAWQPTNATTYDDSYLNYYVGVVDAAWQRGLYVVVDVHQDAFSRYALQGCGEGFPKWALPSTVTPATPDNGASCANWGTRQINDADERKIWDNFFDPQSDAQKAYLAMLGKLAGTLATHPGVIGYDMINEPNGDEPTQLAPLHAAAAAAIRAADASAILFVSPAVVTSAGVATKLPKPAFANFAFAPHYYDPLLILSAGYDGNGEASAIAALRATADDWGVPLFLGEFGVPPTFTDAIGYTDDIYKQLDTTFSSAAQWVYTPGWTAAAKDGWNSEDYSIVDNSGALRANFRPHAYAQKIGGTPTSLAVTEGTSGSVTLTWSNVPAAGSTDLFVPASILGGVTTPSLSTTGGATCTQNGAHVLCSASATGAVSVTVSAMAPPTTTPPTTPRSNKSSCGLTGMEAVAILWMLRRRRRRAA